MIKLTSSSTSSLEVDHLARSSIKPVRVPSARGGDLKPSGRLLLTLLSNDHPSDDHDDHHHHDIGGDDHHHNTSDENDEHDHDDMKNKEGGPGDKKVDSGPGHPVDH